MADRGKRIEYVIAARDEATAQIRKIRAELRAAVKAGDAEAGGILGGKLQAAERAKEDAKYQGVILRQETELQDRLFRATHTGFQVRLRDLDAYWSSVLAKYSANEKMTADITRTYSAERRKLYASEAAAQMGGGAGAGELAGEGGGKYGALGGVRTLMRGYMIAQGVRTSVELATATIKAARGETAEWEKILTSLPMGLGPVAAAFKGLWMEILPIGKEIKALEASMASIAAGAGRFATVWQFRVAVIQETEEIGVKGPELARLRAERERTDSLNRMRSAMAAATSKEERQAVVNTMIDIEKRYHAKLKNLADEKQKDDSDREDAASAERWARMREGVAMQADAMRQMQITQSVATQKRLDDETALYNAMGDIEFNVTHTAAERQKRERAIYYAGLREQWAGNSMALAAIAEAQAAEAKIGEDKAIRAARFAGPGAAIERRFGLSIAPMPAGGQDRVATATERTAKAIEGHTRYFDRVAQGVEKIAAAWENVGVLEMVG